MTEPAAIEATFSDFRLIRGRKVAQLVLEVPIEYADRALAALGGIPQADNERRCAIARLNLKPATRKEGEAIDGKGPLDQPTSVEASPGVTAGARPKRKFEELSASHQAGMLCEDKRFQTFLSEEYAFHEPWAVEQFVRDFCGVSSRAEIPGDNVALSKWIALRTQYDAWLHA